MPSVWNDGLPTPAMSSVPDEFDPQAELDAILASADYVSNYSPPNETSTSLPKQTANPSASATQASIPLIEISQDQTNPLSNPTTESDLHITQSTLDFISAHGVNPTEAMTAFGEAALMGYTVPGLNPNDLCKLFVVWHNILNGKQACPPATIKTNKKRNVIGKKKVEDGQSLRGVEAGAVDANETNSSNKSQQKSLKKAKDENSEQRQKALVAMVSVTAEDGSMHE